MSLHGRSIERSPSERVDVCIVGGGVAGALVMSELADRGYEVVMLEAGERFPMKDRFSRQEIALRPSRTFPEVWDMGGPRDRYVSSGELYYPLNEKRVKGVGGTTLHWGGVTPRLHPKDFEMESRYGLASDWPLSYQELRPYYVAAERELGVAGADDNPFEERQVPFPLPAFPPSETDAKIEAACEDLGIAVHSLPQARNSEGYDGRAKCQGYGTCSPVCPIGAKYSGDAHIRQAEDDGARVIDRAPVQRLIHDRDGTNIEAAVYATPDGSTHRQEAMQFVVACGGVETPRLLLLSRSETYPDGLANSSGLVGRYFMDHPYVTTYATIDESGNPEPIGYTTSQSQQFYDHENPTPGSFLLQFRNVSPVELISPALRGGIDGTIEEMKDPVGGDMWGDQLVDQIRTQQESQPTIIKLDAAIEPLPKKSNSITLDSTTNDNKGNPVPDVSWSLDSHARETIDHAIEVQRRIVETMEGTVRRTNAESPGQGGHHMGTTRMGTDPTKSVVDARLRTHDLHNLTIVSSSTFVTAGAANPTLTIAALALRAADHLDEDL